MKLLKVAAALVCAAGLSAFASTSSITATLTDSDSQTWNNCVWSAKVISPNGTPTVSGTPVASSQLSAAGTCNSSGVISASGLLDVLSVQQSDVTWTFTIMPNAWNQAASVIPGVQVTGTSISLSTTLSNGIKAPRFAAGAQSYGYNDAEIYPSPQNGDIYFNTGTVCGAPSIRQYSNTGWQCGGSGGGGETSGVGVPTSTCTAYSVYIQTDAPNFPIDQSKWTCSKNAVVWTNASTGQVVTAVNNAYITRGALGFYELQETSGSTFADTSGNGNNLTNNGSTPVTFNGGNGVNLGANRYIPLPATWLKNGNTFILCGDFRANETSIPTGVIIAPGPSDGRAFGFDGSGRMGIRNVSSKNLLIGEMSSAFIPQMPGCLSYSASSTVTSTLVSGTVQSPAYIENVPMTVTAQSSLGLGAWPGGQSFGPAAGAKLYKFYVWDRTLDADEIQEMAIAATAKLATQGITLANGFISPAGPELLTLGDSQTAGVASVSLPPGYPPMLAAKLPGGTNFVNLGIASAQSTDISKEADQVPAILSTAGSPVQRIGILWGATNDIFSGRTPAQTFTAYSAIASTLKQSSLKTIYLTMMPSTRCVTTCEAARQTYNATWSASSITDGLVDIGDDLRFSNPGFTPFLGSDGLHPVDIGYNIIAGRTLTEINRIRATGDIGVVPVAYSSTPDFDLSKGLHQSILLTGNVTKFTVSNFNQGTQFQIDFIQDATGGRTVGIGVIGSGATATAPLTGTTPVFTLGSGGSNYSSAFPPIIVASGGTCTRYPKFVAVITGDAVSAGNGPGSIAGNCTVAPTLTFVSTEPVWHSPSALTTTTPNTTTILNGTYDTTANNVVANLQTAQ